MLPNADYEKCVGDCAREIFQALAIRNGRIMVSGATGLIGQAIVDCLLWANRTGMTSFKVAALARNGERAEGRLGMYFGHEDFRFVPGDVNQEIPEIGDVDYVIHAASNSHPRQYSSDPIGTIRTNVLGTENLLDYARLHQCKRFVFLSSVEIYGENRGETEKLREIDFGYLDCNQLRSGYPESKRLGESLCCAYAEKYSMDIVIPRLCRVYGPTMGQDDSKALAQFIRKAVDGEDIVLKSEGRQHYSYVHVMDAVKAIFYILDRGEKGQAYNVSSELSDIRLRSLADKLAEIAGTKVVFELPGEEERKGYSSATKAVLDNTKLKRLGWKESFDIDSGLRMTVGILKSLVKG